jgi:hypothetical protein
MDRHPHWLQVINSCIPKIGMIEGCRIRFMIIYLTNFLSSPGFRIRKFAQSLYCKPFFKVGSFDLTDVLQNSNNSSHLSAISLS